METKTLIVTKDACKKLTALKDDESFSEAATKIISKVSLLSIAGIH